MIANCVKWKCHWWFSKDEFVLQSTSSSCERKCLVLTHWGRVAHIWVSKLSTICSDNGLSPGRRQAIIWTSAGTLLIWTIGTNFNEMLIEIHTFSVKKIHLKMSSTKWWPFCLGLNGQGGVTFDVSEGYVTAAECRIYMTLAKPSVMKDRDSHLC